MKSTAVKKPDWQAMLDRVSQHHEKHQITIEIDKLSIGAQTEAEQVQLLGIAYDPKSDAIAVNADGLEHRIQRPSKVEFAYEGADLICIEIVDANGALHLVKFTPPLSYPELEQP